jgi:hypothetical protein
LPLLAAIAGCPEKSSNHSKRAHFSGLCKAFILSEDLLKDNFCPYSKGFELIYLGGFAGFKEWDNLVQTECFFG